MQAPGTERAQALADSSHSALCCHSNEICAPIANPPNSAQLDRTLYHSPNLHLGRCSSVRMRRGTGRQTDTQTAVTNIHFALATPHAKCNEWFSSRCCEVHQYNYDTRELIGNAYNMKASAGIDAVVKMSPNQNTGWHQSLSMVQSNSTRARDMTKSLQ